MRDKHLPLTSVIVGVLGSGGDSRKMYVQGMFPPVLFPYGCLLAAGVVRGTAK